MEILINKESFYFYGRLDDFFEWIKAFPADWTVKEFLKYQLH